MLNKNCKVVLKALIEDLEHEPPQGYTLQDLNKMVHIKREGVNDICRIAEYLVEDGFLTAERSGPKISGIHVDSHYWLTEKGRYFRMLTKKKIIDYFLAHWIDIIALVVSIIAVCVAIYRNGDVICTHTPDNSSSQQIIVETLSDFQN